MRVSTRREMRARGRTQLAKCVKAEKEKRAREDRNAKSRESVRSEEKTRREEEETRESRAPQLNLREPVRTGPRQRIVRCKREAEEKCVEATSERT